MVEPRVAVVGAGVAGISAAYHLRGAAEVTLFDAADRVGGHANTIEIQENGATVGLDTAFVVYNEAHYPTFTKFLADLGVPTKAHPGKFSYFDLSRDQCYVSDDFALSQDEFAAKYPPEIASLWAQERRFSHESRRDFLRGRTNVPLGEYLESNGYSAEFRYGFIVLLATAVWSVPPDQIWEMPASTVIAFFFAHGYEGLGSRSVPWRTIHGGSITYVRAAMRQLRADGQTVRVGHPVLGVSEDDTGVSVRSAAGVERFDSVVLATHADDSVRMLDRLAPGQEILREIPYYPNTVYLHSDPSCLPADRSAWRSWNYGKADGPNGPRTWAVYYLNELQQLNSGRDFFLTLGEGPQPDPRHVIAELEYRHPIFSDKARAAQRDIHSVNGLNSRVKFAGSYFHSRQLGPDIIGGHESAFDSGAAAAAAVLHRLSQPTAH